MEELLPPKSGPNFSFGSEDGKESNEHALFGKLNSMVKGKSPVREIISWIDESLFPMYLNYIKVNGQILGDAEFDNTFGWDNKHVGARILLSKVSILH